MKRKLGSSIKKKWKEQEERDTNDRLRKIRKGPGAEGTISGDRN